MVAQTEAALTVTVRAAPSCSGGRIRTCDLWVMSPASYRAAPPRVGENHPTSLRTTEGCGGLMPSPAPSAAAQPLGVAGALDAPDFCALRYASTAFCKSES